MALKQISPNKVNHDKTDITTLQVSDFKGNLIILELI